MGEAEEIVREMPTGLLRWYNFTKGAAVLYIGSPQDVMAKMLIDQGLETACLSCGQSCEQEWMENSLGRFDYLISTGTLEKCRDPAHTLCVWRKLLRMNGHMLLGVNNRFGVRYFCGDADPHTGRNFDGIDGGSLAYQPQAGEFEGRCYSRGELEHMLREAGWQSCRFFSVFPGLENPCLIYAEDCLPKEDLGNRVYPSYFRPESVFLEEEKLYGSLAENKMFHQMANAYLIECTAGKGHSDAAQITISMERGRQHAQLTVIHKSGIVEKRAAYPEGEEMLEGLAANMHDLAEQGVPAVRARMEGGVCVMPYIDGETGQAHLKRMLRTDRRRFLEEMDHFRDLILKSSEAVGQDAGNGEGIILRRGYPDMVPLNSIWQNGTFVFFDQEFCVEHYPANAVVIRMIDSFYSRDAVAQRLLAPEELLKRYGLTGQLERWRKMEREFLKDLRKERQLRRYHDACRAELGTIHSNRQRVNYPEEEYQRLFVRIFQDTDRKEVILFGSGRYAAAFLELYRQECPVYAVIDNDREKWGQDIAGIRIQPPQALEQLPEDGYKVLICMKEYTQVIKQLEAMGVKDYGVFDPNRGYPRRRGMEETSPQYAAECAQGQQEDSGRRTAAKKYHTGYLAGVFDLFHIGHLKLIRRAKEQCGYLIVGVVTDEGVRRMKGAAPFIPFAERIEIVRSCQYVDKAVKIPLNHGGTADAFRLYHFDCQFSGSDYAENPDWLAQKAFLQKHGADMVFFPYTEGTSSTKLKALIQKHLL